MRDVLNRWRRALVLGACVLCATGSVRLHAQAEAAPRLWPAPFSILMGEWSSTPLF
jgi:hypothetical protein